MQTGDLSLPNNKAVSSNGGKSNYKRKAVAVAPRALPFKRQPEGSVLTGGSVSKGAVQPYQRTGSQSMSKLKKGVD